MKAIPILFLTLWTDHNFLNVSMGTTIYEHYRLCIAKRLKNSKKEKANHHPFTM